MTNEELLPTAAAGQPPCEELVRVCDGDMRFCKAMSSRMEDGYKKGINACRMMDTKTGEESAPIILYKSLASDQGLILNFCPWCGKPLNRKLLAHHRRAQKSQRTVVTVPPQAKKGIE